MRERARDEGGWGGVNVGEFGKCGLGVGKSHRRVHADGDRTTMSLEGLCSEREARWFYVGWSRVYDAMQPFFTSDEMREAGLDLLPGGINGTQQILDVGAGTGTLSLQVLKRAPDARLTLLDQSAPMLDRAKLKPALEGATFVLADAQALPLDFIQRFAIVGPPEACVERLNALCGLGVQRLFLTFPRQDQFGDAARAVTERFAREVLPQIK